VNLRQRPSSAWTAQYQPRPGVMEIIRKPRRPLFRYRIQASAAKTKKQKRLSKSHVEIDPKTSSRQTMGNVPRHEKVSASAFEIFRDPPEPTFLVVVERRFEYAIIRRSPNTRSGKETLFLHTSHVTFLLQCDSGIRFRTVSHLQNWCLLAELPQAAARATSWPSLIS